MQVSVLRSFFVMFLVAALTPPVTAAETAQATVALEAWMVNAFEQPTYVTHAGDERLFVTEQAGTVQVVPDVADPSTGAQLFLDITDRVGSSGSEQGLLSMAFPPESHAGSPVYVSYTALDGGTVVSRLDVAEDGLSADPDSERVILTHPQPYPNHNGGLILFGPDDLLYIGLGDGGSGGDPEGNAQNPDTWLGSILRIDVNPDVVGDAGYAVPAENPFVGDADAQPEVWMYGLRNPWRFAFDAAGTMIAVADVGQNAVEEATILPLEAARGANLGWPILEGTFCYEVADCDSTGTILPSLEYTHEEGGCSVTGGEFIEAGYLYADYCSGLLWLATQTGDGWEAGMPLETRLSISSFGRGSDGAVYVVDRAGGSIYHVVVPSAHFGA
ncbi:MAG TPA: PQQ-dependent sugar dehydrogenase [Thermomicrobiales bacterium]|nr:PQQ-dependent sugar dehydrogenase [Thermomicrobiales bacterium]